MNGRHRLLLCEPHFKTIFREKNRFTMSDQRRSDHILKWLILVSLMPWLCLALPLSAQDQTISQMVHTSWTGRDGAPQGIFALAQTPDGILWINSYAGIFTFDGVRFDPFHAKTGSPPLRGGTFGWLFVSKAGDLWIFPMHNPAVRIHQGEARSYGRVQGEDLFSLRHPQEDSNGTLWAVLNERHLVKLGSDGIWHQQQDPIESPSNISQLFIDSSDTQWVIQNEGLYRRSKDETEFTATGVQVYGLARIAESRDHSLWVAQVGLGPADSLNLQHIDQTGRKLFAPRVHGQIDQILSAQDGSLWTFNDEGLRRLDADTLAGHHSEALGGASDFYARSNSSKNLDAHALLSDFDGNIWVGGTGGLDRFQRASLTPAIPNAKMGLWHSCVDTRGEVWIANTDVNLRLFYPKSSRATVVQNGDGDSNLFCEKDGQVYLIGDSGISVVRDGHIRQLPLLPGHGSYGASHYKFVGVTEDPDGDLIAAVGGPAEHGLWRYRAGKWSRYLPDLALPEICGMLMDTKGRLYLGFANSADTLGRIERGSLTILNGSGALSFAQTSYGVIAYGSKGIAVDRENRFQRFTLLHPEQARAITGVVESRNGDLWMNGGRGIVRIPAVEVGDAIADPTHAVASVNLQEGDFVGPDLPLYFRNSAHIDPAGRLWFSTMNGVVSVDPDHLAAPQRPPLLAIRSIIADGHEMDASATFPPDTHTLEVKYFGLDLTDPRRVVYRYRLEGLGSDSRDSSWQDAGPRTDATYTHLRPGSYQFQVMASNGNDIWTMPVSSSTFRILPHFYERPWVQGLFVLAGVLLAWFAISLRVRYVSSAIRIRAEERADERVRIARELHDTLLQGVQGLLLSFHVAAEKVPADHESKPALERALTTADRIIVEGRNRVTRLRSENLNDAELKSLIEGVAANHRPIAAIEFTIERKGGTETLQSHVVDEVFCIAREAVTNAYRHSGGSRIVVELDYQKREFKMTCRDNGRGFDSKKFLTNRTNGHWGLRGMAERAERIGAEFFYDSTVSGGTKVHVIVPARRAYQRRGRFGFFARRTAA
jgi:signal transduction histidine kinase/ligand-binding sensor domain-containing protein